MNSFNIFLVNRWTFSKQKRINYQSDKKVGVIRAGFAGMSAAALLAKHGYQVTVFEKMLLPVVEPVNW